MCCHAQRTIRTLRLHHCLKLLEFYKSVSSQTSLAFALPGSWLLALGSLLFALCSSLFALRSVSASSEAKVSVSCSPCSLFALCLRHPSLASASVSVSASFALSVSVSCHPCSKKDALPTHFPSPWMVKRITCIRSSLNQAGPGCW